jgi:hypothetical protein
LVALLLYNFGSVLRKQNKTLIALGDKNTAGTAPKTAFRRGAESSFCLWQKLGNLNQKIAHSGEDLDFFSEMVLGAGVEPARLLGKTF